MFCFLLGPHYPLDPFEKTHDILEIDGSVNWIFVPPPHFLSFFSLSKILIQSLPCIGDFATEFHTFGLVWNEKEIYTYVDDDSNKILDVKIDKSFWELGGWDDKKIHNPWEGRGKNAPFDQVCFVCLCSHYTDRQIKYTQFKFYTKRMNHEKQGSNRLYISFHPPPFFQGILHNH